MGFSVPMLAWFRNELKTYLYDYLHPDRLKRAGLLNHEAVVALRDTHFSGAGGYFRHLWFFLMFEMWYER